MTAIFPENLVRQEMCPDRWVEIPEPVRDIYALWRPTPLLRAVRFEKALQTPAHIYYKYEGASPAGSHKPNTSVAAGLLQQGGRHEAAGHRNRRRPMGLLAGAGLPALRPGVQRLHGQGELPAEALPADAHAHLGRHGPSQPQRPDRIRPQVAGRRPAIVPAAWASPSARPSRTPSPTRTPSIRWAACSTTFACTRRSSARKPSTRWNWRAKSRTPIFALLRAAAAISPAWRSRSCAASSPKANATASSPLSLRPVLRDLNRQA